jgi:plastocyanin
MHIHSRRINVLLASLTSLGAIALGACGGDGSVTGPVDQTPVPAATIQATPAIKFTPGTVTVVVGGTVTFNFGAVEHNVFFDNAPAGAPANITAPSANRNVVLTFPTVGTYVYNCHIHPGMRGTVIVK